MQAIKLESLLTAKLARVRLVQQELREFTEKNTALAYESDNEVEYQRNMALASAYRLVANKLQLALEEK